MDGELGLAGVIAGQGLGDLRRGDAGQQVHPQGDGDLHAGIVVVHDGAEHRRGRQAGHRLHLGQVLVVQGQAVGPGGAVEGGAAAVLVFGDHFFAAAGIAGQAVAGEGVVRRDQPQLHQGPGQGDEARSMAPGHRHPAGGADGFPLAVQLREAVHPPRRGAEGGGGVQHLDLPADPGQDLPGGGVGQAEESKVRRIDDLGPGLQVFAAGLGDGEQLQLGPAGQPLGDPQAGGPGGAVDEYLAAHALASSSQASRAVRAWAIWALTLAALGPP